MQACEDSLCEVAYYEQKFNQELAAASIRRSISIFEFMAGLEGCLWKTRALRNSRPSMGGYFD